MDFIFSIPSLEGFIYQQATASNPLIIQTNGIYWIGPTGPTGSGGVGTTYSVSNGLSIVGNDIQLGGTLTHNTDISGPYIFTLGSIIPLTTFSVKANNISLDSTVNFDSGVQTINFGTYNLNRIIFDNSFNTFTEINHELSMLTGGVNFYQSNFKRTDINQSLITTEVININGFADVSNKLTQVVNDSLDNYIELSATDITNTNTSFIKVENSPFTTGQVITLQAADIIANGNVTINGGTNNYIASFDNIITASNVNSFYAGLNIFRTGDVLITNGLSIEAFVGSGAAVLNIATSNTYITSTVNLGKATTQLNLTGVGISLNSTSINLPNATANTILYVDGSKNIKSVTLGSGLSLVSGTLSAVSTAISLTTSGNSGSSTLISNILNVPTYTLAGLGGQPLLSGTGFVKSTAGVITYDTNTYVTPTSTNTLSNKRITSRTLTITSSATPTININNYDNVDITALATDITSMTSGLTGTPNNFDKLIIRIKDNGTSRAITWGASFNSGASSLPFKTTSGQVTVVQLLYNSTTSTWNCVFSSFVNGNFKYTDTTNGATVNTAGVQLISQFVKIPANTLTSGTLRIKAKSIKTGGTSFCWNYIYINTANSMSGAQNLGQIQNAGNNTLDFLAVERTIPIKVGTFYRPALNTNYGYEENIAQAIAVTVDWTVDQYILSVVQVNSAPDTLTGNYFTVIQE